MGTDQPTKRTRSQIGRSSKRKGNSNERAIAKLLQEWWGNGVTFSRTPSSGGWGNNVQFQTKGDIVCSDQYDPTIPLDEKCPLHIEAKACEGWHLEQLLTGDRSLILQWWDQTTTECPPNRFPLLLFKRNHIPLLCMLKLADFPSSVLLKDIKHIIFNDLLIVSLNDFFTFTKREDWIKRK